MKDNTKLQTFKLEDGTVVALLNGKLVPVDKGKTINAVKGNEKPSRVTIRDFVIDYLVEGDVQNMQDLIDDARKMYPDSSEDSIMATFSHLRREGLICYRRKSSNRERPVVLTDAGLEHHKTSRPEKKSRKFSKPMPNAEWVIRKVVEKRRRKEELMTLAKDEGMFNSNIPVLLENLTNAKRLYQQDGWYFPTTQVLPGFEHDKKIEVV